MPYSCKQSKFDYPWCKLPFVKLAVIHDGGVSARTLQLHDTIKNSKSIPSSFVISFPCPLLDLYVGPVQTVFVDFWINTKQTEQTYHKPVRSIVKRPARESTCFSLKRALGHTSPRLSYSIPGACSSSMTLPKLFVVRPKKTKCPLFWN